MRARLASTVFEADEQCGGNIAVGHSLRCQLGGALFGRFEVGTVLMRDVGTGQLSAGTLGLRRRAYLAEGLQGVAQVCAGGARALREALLRRWPAKASSTGADEKTQERHEGRGWEALSWAFPLVKRHRDRRSRTSSRRPERPELRSGRPSEGRANAPIVEDPRMTAATNARWSKPVRLGSNRSSPSPLCSKRSRMREPIITTGIRPENAGLSPSYGARASVAPSASQ